MSRELLLAHIRPESPLLLGEQSGAGNFQQSLDFIPGAVLRGAVAKRLRETAGDEAADAFFAGEEAWFGNGYAGDSGLIFSMPATAVTCKRYPGFAEKDESKHHGIYDSLLADFAYGLVSDPYFPARALMQPTLGGDWSVWQPTIRKQLAVCRVKGCGESLETAGKQGVNYYRWDNREEKTLPTSGFVKSRATHVGINRARAVAEDALLFTQETLLPGEAKNKVFFAQLSIPTEKKVLLLSALEGEHFLGRGRSRGYGKVTVSTGRIRNELPPMATRLEGFAGGLKSALRPYFKADERVQTELPGLFFALTCRAPAILTDFGQPVRIPTPDMLGMPAGTVSVGGWARMEQVGGWHAAAGLPRRTQLATKAGSVFLYFVPDGKIEDCVGWLEDLENAGIGEERARGYGAITVCAPFHTERMITR